jgi:hypothetical protein
VCRPNALAHRPDCGRRARDQHRQREQSSLARLAYRYALIDATEAGYRVEHRRVEYDVEAVIQAVERSRHPSGSFIISHFRGERRPWWANGTG